jgi:hypothetical protein
MKLKAVIWWQLLLACICTMAVPSIVWGGTLNLNGNWRYSRNDNDDSNFSQSYSANYAGTADLTDLLKLRGNLRYTTNINDDNETTDFISPSLSLLNNNEFYSFSINGNYNYYRNSESINRESWNWASQLVPNLLDPLPFVRLFYGQSGQSDDEDRQDDFSQFGGVNSDWNYFDWLGLSYSLNWNKREEKNTDIENESLGHYAKLNTGKIFLQGRLALGFSQSYQKTYQDFSAPVTGDGFALAPVIVSQAAYEEIDDPLTGGLTNDASFLLTDADDPPTTLDIDPANDPMNLGVRVDFQQVDAVYLATLEDDSSFASSITWDMYTSNNGIDWQLAAENVLFVYNDIENRFEFEFASQTVRYLKLVADTSSLLPDQITRIESIEAFEKVFGEGDKITRDSDNSFAQTSFSANYRPQPGLSLSYNFGYDKTDNSSGIESERISNSGSMSWSPSKYFSTRLNASQSNNELTDNPDTKSRSYSASITSVPLATLSFSFGAKRSESYEDDDLENARNTYSSYTTAQLYDDLSASLALNYSTNEKGAGSDNFSSTLSISARLRPTLLLTFNDTYSDDLDSGGQSTNSLSATLNWRASEFMNLNNTVSAAWQDGTNTTRGLSSNLSLTPNTRNRLNLGYNWLWTEEFETHSFTGFWNLLLNKRFNLRTGGTYFIADDQDDDSWAISGTLTYQYNNMF